MSSIKSQLEFLKNKLLTSNKRNIIRQLSVDKQNKFIDLYKLTEENTYGTTIKKIEEKLILKGESVLLLHSNEQDDSTTLNSTELKKLCDEYQKLMKIKGKSELYIGYIFLERYVRRGAKGNEYVRAPLFLIP